MEVNGRIGVVGAGSWGTVLAWLLADKGYPVDLWVYEEDLCRIIAEKRENTFYLPGWELPGNLTPHNDLRPVVEDHPLVVMVVPSHVYRGVALQLREFLSPKTILVSATKGIENDTLLTMGGVWREIMEAGRRPRYTCLAGPSFAKEVIRRLPTAITVACEDPETAQIVQHTFHTPHFRVYTSHDTIGVELAGALKNVIALAAGCSDGLGFGHNTRAALITRGLAEISRLGMAMGANPLTFQGLSGVGDLLLTCTSELSRNRTVGYLLGQGNTLDAILKDMRMVAEGIKTARSARNLAVRMNVEMPITDQVYGVIYEGLQPRDAVWNLLGRDLKHEIEIPSS